VRIVVGRTTSLSSSGFFGGVSHSFNLLLFAFFGLVVLAELGKDARIEIQ
jgi:hypothetical protein